MKNEIILYRPDEQAEHIEVRLENETAWLNRQQIATLFGRDVKTIGKHINNVFAEGELLKNSTVANFATVHCCHFCRKVYPVPTGTVSCGYCHKMQSCDSRLLSQDAILRQQGLLSQDAILRQQGHKMQSCDSSLLTTNG